MTIIFLSGSMSLSNVGSIEYVLKNIITEQLNVIIGDANGIDKSIQRFFKDNNYDKVTIYCSGNKCRNNVGTWDVVNVIVNKSLTGREFYTVKDKKMSEVADCGFVIWDEHSLGSKNNIIELVKQQKPTLVYLSHQRKLVMVYNVYDVDLLFS